MKTLSLDLPERILASYDAGEGTRADIFIRFRVSEGMVQKLLQQRRNIGSIANRHGMAGRKPMILETHRISFALEKVTPDDAVGWFASCGYTIYQIALNLREAVSPRNPPGWGTAASP